MGSLLEKVENVERVSDLYLKGYKPAEIGRTLDLTPAQVRGYIREYKDYVSSRVMEDPDFLDRLQENTLEAIERLDMLVKEAWDTYETARNNDMMNQQINLLKVAGSFEQQRAGLLQLMGAKVDSGMMARMQRAEQVNEIVSRIIKDVVSDCPRCKIQVAPRLAEAFAKMGQQSEAADMQPEAEYEDAEIVVEEEWSEDQQADMFVDVIAAE